MFSLNETDLNEKILNYCSLQQIEIWWRRRSGESSKFIIDELGVSRSILENATKKVESKVNAQDEWWFGLYTQSINALRAHTNINSKQVLLASLKSGELAFIKNKIWYKSTIFHGAGKKAFMDYVDFCELDIDIAPPSTPLAISKAISLLEKNGYQVITPCTS
jgi:hypothetical protein